MKKVVLLFALSVGLLASASTQAQVNMSRYITLTVADGAAIKLNFKAAAEGTPVRIVSGSNTQDITVGTNWYNGSNPSTFKVTAQGTEMKVYGDIVAFKCSGNYANLTAIDISNNTQLTMLDCGVNQLTTLDVSNNTQLTTLYCTISLLTALDVSNNTQLKELYCVTNQLTALDVSNNTRLEDLRCYNNRISSLDVSNNTQLKELWCNDNKLTALDVSNNTQLKELYCHRNQLSSLDVSYNTQLKKLICWGNNFSTQALDDIYCSLPDRTDTINGVILPVYDSSDPNHATVLATNKTNATAKNWKVQYYNGGNDIPATTGSYTCPQPNMSRYITLTVGSGESIRLDFWATANQTPIRIVSGSNTQDIIVNNVWKGSAHFTTDGTTMTIYGDLKRFDCAGNRANITALDVSNSPMLETLLCQGNQISRLKVSGNNTNLSRLICFGNNLTTATLDDIYCSLPDRTSTTNGVIEPVYNASSSNHTIVLATNAQNAIDKNWNVQYSDDNADITTNGSYVCGTPHTDIAEATAEQVLTLYPNPVADVLYLSATARTIRIYDMYGTEVAHATDTDRIDVAHLPAGVYTVRADGMVAKMVKR